MSPSTARRTLSILVVEAELPLHDLRSSSVRMRALLELLVEDGHAVTFLGRAGVGQDRYAHELRVLGIEVHPYDPDRLRAQGLKVPEPGIDLRGLLRRGRFDLAWLSYYTIAEEYLPEIRRHSPATRIVVDSVDVHHVRERRGAELAGDAARLASAERTREREAAVYAQADALVAVSADDAAELRKLAPDVPVTVVSNIHRDQPQTPGFAARSGIVFVGAFDHAPNVDAVLDFHARAWPPIARARPQASLTLVGWAPPPAVQALAGDRVAVTGWVPDTAPYLDAARVSIAPLRFGAGVKGKIGEALGRGLPVVTSPVGAEGMGLVDSEHVLIAEPGPAFADAVVRLHADEDLWTRLAGAGRALIAQRLSPDVARDAIRDLFDRTVPTCFIAPWGDALEPALRDYVETYSVDDAVSMMLPLTPSDPAPDDAFAHVAGVVERLGADPDAIPDVALVPCAETPPVPAGATLCGPRAPSERAARASIVICCYGKRDYTERCLASLESALGSSLGEEYELVVVDNASPDSTRELLADWDGRARTLALPRNLNFAGGNNAGARVATGRTLIFLNNDTVVAPGTIEALVDEAERPGVGAVGARLTYPNGTLQHGGFVWREAPGVGLTPFHLFQHELGDDSVARASFDVGAVTAACVAVPADVFDAVGGFDEDYVNGWEDVDLCYRVRAAGARVRYRGDTDIVHHEGITSGSGYHSDGNLPRFIERWAPTLASDGAFVRDVLGADFSPIADLPRPPDAAGGAGVRVAAPVTGLGAAAAEGRAIVRGLAQAGVPIAAGGCPQPLVGPQLDHAELELLARALVTPARQDALEIRVGACGPGVARLAGVPAATADGTLALAASPAVASELVAAGWPRGAVEALPPLAIDSGRGEGGGGILVLLPADAHGIAELPRGARLVPHARTPELERAASTCELLAPVTGEAALAELAAESDVVLALDPGDVFGRRALVCAASGAAVVTSPHSAAAWILGDLAVTTEHADRRAIGRAREMSDAAARMRRCDAVARACADAQARLVELLAARARLHRQAA